MFKLTISVCVVIAITNLCYCVSANVKDVKRDPMHMSMLDVDNAPKKNQIVEEGSQTINSEVLPHRNLDSRHRRDISFPGLKKPTHHDVIIPNWNPNAKTKPWQMIGVKNRQRRNA